MFPNKYTQKKKLSKFFQKSNKNSQALKSDQYHEPDDEFFTHDQTHIGIALIFQLVLLPAPAMPTSNK